MQENPCKNYLTITEVKLTYFCQMLSLLMCQIVIVIKSTNNALFDHLYHWNQ